MNQKVVVVTEAEEEHETEDESRATGEITYNSESEDSEELDNLEIDEKNVEHYPSKHLPESKSTTETKKHDANLSDDDGPPVLSPMMPLLPENMSVEQPISHKLGPIVPLTEKDMRDLSEIRNRSSPKSMNLYEKRLSNNESPELESETICKSKAMKI